MYTYIYAYIAIYSYSYACTCGSVGYARSNVGEYIIDPGNFLV